MQDIGFCWILVGGFPAGPCGWPNQPLQPAIPLWGTTTRPYHRLWDRRVALWSGVFWQVWAYIIRDTCMSHLSISLSVYQSIYLPIYLSIYLSMIEYNIIWYNWHYILLYSIRFHYIILYYIILYYVILCYVISYCITLIYFVYIYILYTCICIHTSFI